MHDDDDQRKDLRVDDDSTPIRVHKRNYCAKEVGMGRPMKEWIHG